MTNTSSNDSYLELSFNQIVSPQGELITSASWWQQKSIRFKTTVLAIAIGTIPTLALGTTAYTVAANSLRQESITLRQNLVVDLQNQVNVFMSDRFNDIKVMANLDIFTNPKLRDISTSTEKSAALQRIQDNHKFYNSIGVFDLQGNVIAQTAGKPLGNHLNRSYVQAALKADGAVISQPRISTSTGIFSVYTAAPIKDKVTGQTIGFIRARIPVEVLKNLLQDHTTQGSQYYLLNDQDEIFLGSAGEYVIKTRSDNSTVENKTFAYEATKAVKIFPGTETLLNSSNLATDTAIHNQQNKEQLLIFAPAKTVTGLPQLNWQAIIATDTAIVYAPQRNLRQIFFLGTGIVALGVGVLAYSLANRLIRPLLSAAQAVREIGRGNLDTRLDIIGADEVAQLSDDINRMAVKLSDLLQSQALLAQQSETIKNITLRLASADDQAEILQIAVTEILNNLSSDQVIYYQFKNDLTGIVVAESVSPGFPPSLEQEIYDSETITTYFSRYYQEKLQVQLINDLAQADLTQSQQDQLQSLGVKSVLIAPVVVEKKLDGLLIAHQYSNQRSWADADEEFITQVTNQIGFAITRLELLNKQKLAEIKEKEAKEALQNRALDLLQEVYEVSQGDLTVRAKVTEDEIGTIADSYNSTIESLKNLVNNTKTAAIEVQENTSTNDIAVQKLAQEAVNQSVEINRMLQQVKAMEESINLVTLSASQAEEYVKQAGITIDSGNTTMNRTVAEINAVQTTVAETVSKAQKLGESSQEISQAVNLISRFAAQTHLLALKASIEAARAGEQGKGFAVIADEVRSLASQSAEATAEIDTLVSKIQLETNEVMTAMNKGTEQIVLGNQLVQQTCQSLAQVSQVSNEISQLVDSIAQAAKLQSDTSVQVNQTMVKVATIAENNSQSATKVSSSIKQLSAIAHQLQSDIDKFKT